MGQEIFRRDSRLICGGQSFYGADIGSSSTNELYLENGNNRLRWSRGGNLYQSVASFDVGSTSEPNNSMWTRVEDGIRRLYVARGGRKITMSHLQYSLDDTFSSSYFDGNQYGSTIHRVRYDVGTNIRGRLLITKASVWANAGGSNTLKDIDLNVVNDNSTAIKREIVGGGTSMNTTYTEEGGLTSGQPVGYVDPGEQLFFVINAGVFATGTIYFRFSVEGWYAPNQATNKPIFQ